MNGKIAIDGGLCMGCGLCINQCPTEALSLIRDETKPAPLEINILAPTSLGS
jgi:ferredoxin